MPLLPDEEYRVHHGDTIPFIHSLPTDCIDFSIYSPPFPTVFAYTDKSEDMGNSEDLEHEAPLHFSWFFRAMLRVLKPGRVMMVHCTQFHYIKRSGREGTCDFRGLLISLARRAGFIYEYDWLITVNPQAEAVRLRSHSLQFAGLDRDRANAYGCTGMHMLKLRKPGENLTRINSPNEVSRQNWIDWAECAWTDIRQTDTLNVAEARDERDTRHICPLQLEIYRRFILLFSDPGELVFDPFAGICSCGYMALGGVSPSTNKRIDNPRRFLGCELKDTYHATALRNCEKAIAARRSRQRTLFDSLPSPSSPPVPSPQPEETKSRRSKAKKNA